MFSYTLLSVLTADLLATSGDITQSWTSPIFPKLRSNDSSVNPLGKPITSEEDAWIGSLVNIGAMIGSLPFGFLAVKFGRKVALLSIAVPHIIAYLTFAFAKNIYLYYFARFLGGLSVGGGYTVIPMYIAEIAEDSSRGAMSVTLNIFWSFGNFIPLAIGPYISIEWFNLILAAIPLAFFIAFLLIAPETPYYLVSINQIHKAEKSLMLLRSLDKDGVKKEIEKIKSNIKKHEDGSLSDILMNKGLRKAFAISLILIIYNQLSGVNAIGYYMQPIFEASGTNIPSDISSTICGFFIFTSSFFTPFLADRAGRRILLIISCLAIFIALGLLGAFFYIHDSTNINTKPVFWLPILCVILFIFSFNFGLSSLPWTISSELFPNNVKSISSVSVSTMCYASSFLITKFFDDMNDSFGIATSFWFFAGSSLSAAIFTYVFVPETKGKSFSEIHDMLQN